ncbi:MAG TPA: hypothetical protein VNQ77_00555 [Frankiaceae bacterium]|nr:hypothetical protein [Frankiaceae bacterium]
MPRRVLPLALAVTVAAATVAVASPARPRPGSAPRPTVVVAVADSGINPYHEAFYRPKNTAHPCTYVVGFKDCSIRALPLSVGKFKDYDKAVEADKKLWASVEAHVWYWIPKTNIIGAVCDGDATSPTDVSLDPKVCILDENGHGTGTASSVISESPDALLLVHEGNSAANDLPSAPVVADVQTHSWGPPAPLPLHLAKPVTQDFEPCSAAERNPASLFFIAAGNEVPWPAILDCDRQPEAIQIVGGGYPGHWTPASWSTFDFASWFCRPVALHKAVKGTDEHCGTSFSSPTAAGAAAEALLRLRRQEGYTGRNTAKQMSRTVTRAKFVQAMRDAATYSPKDKFPKAGTLCDEYVMCTVSSSIYGRVFPLPPGAEHVFWGYGWLDGTVTPAIVSCVRGGACPKKSAAATEWNATRQEVRGTSNDARPFTPGPQDDAGTKRDAGADRRAALPVAAGREYTGTIEPYVLGGDMRDSYAFRAKAGQKISIASTSMVDAAVPVDIGAAVGCWFLISPDGRSMDPERGTVPMFQIECDSAGVNEPPKDVEAPETGTYVAMYVAHNGLPKHDYRFTIAVAT